MSEITQLQLDRTARSRLKGFQKAGSEILWELAPRRPPQANILLSRLALAKNSDDAAVV